MTSSLEVGIPFPIVTAVFRSAGRGRGRVIPLAEGHHQEESVAPGVWIWETE